ATATRIATEGGAAPGDVVEFQLADEPAWNYPAVLQEVRNDAGWLTDFRAYVEQKAADNNLQPADFGLTGWDDPHFVPIGGSEAVDSGSRHLFYWTMRYFPEQASQGILLARQALQRVFPNLQTVDVNWNNFPSSWYLPDPNTGPDSGLGLF